MRAAPARYGRSRGHRVVGVGDREDPRLERDLVAGETVRDSRAPSQRSWWWSTQSSASRSDADRRRACSTPRTGCVRISSSSSGVERSRLARSARSSASLPMSCSGPPSRIARMRCSASVDGLGEPHGERRSRGRRGPRRSGSRKTSVCVSIEASPIGLITVPCPRRRIPAAAGQAFSTASCACSGDAKNAAIPSGDQREHGVEPVAADRVGGRLAGRSRRARRRRSPRRCRRRRSRGRTATRACG